LEKQKAKQVQEELILEAKAREIYERLNNFSLSFTLKKGEKGEPFGSVGFKEILEELTKTDFRLEKSQLVDFHPLNKLGEHTVLVKLSSKLTANLKIIVK
jgi:ribosomal protein L9